MAVYSMMFMGMAPIGALVAGSLAHRLGAPRTVLIGGIVCVFGAAIFALRLPKLRDEGRRLIVSLQLTGGSPAAEATGEASALADQDAG
jgi:MFS-type transporter involved in bile tolerance (Atg22 family)